MEWLMRSSGKCTPAHVVENSMCLCTGCDAMCSMIQDELALPIMNVSVQGSTMAEATTNPTALPRASAYASQTSHMQFWLSGSSGLVGYRKHSEPYGKLTLPDVLFSVAPQLWPEQPGVGEPQPRKKGEPSIEQCCSARWK